MSRERRQRRGVGPAQFGGIGVALMVWVALVAGCASARTVRPPDQMRIYNLGRRPIVELRTKRCGETDAAFKPVANSAMDVGASYTLPLTQGCVELIVVGADGQIMGRQAELHMMAGSTWTIR